MLAIENLSKRFGSQILFQNAAFSLSEQERIGVVGPNGAGKSTFFKILMGEEDVDEGKVHIPNHYRILLMKQEWHPEKGDTILGSSLKVFKLWFEAKNNMESLGKKLESDESFLASYHEAESEFLSLGGYQVEVEVKEILSGLGFKPHQFDQQTHTFSGGWRMRCYLAGLLVQKADLLLLDEPTNHLDMDSVVWFENFLQNYPKSIMLISHDRRLVQTLSKKILEFSPPKLTLWPGSLSKFEANKSLRMDQLEKEITHKSREMEKLQNFARRFGAKASKARQAQNKLRNASHFEDEIQKLKAEMPIDSVRVSKFSLQLNKRQPKVCMQIEKAVFGYSPETPLFSIDKGLIESGKKIGIIGDNGVGKSTFLKTCAGEIKVLSGKLDIYAGAKISLFGQHRMEELPLSLKAIDYLIGESDKESISQIRSIAASLGMGQNDLDKVIGVLSGGEKARVSLARILLQKPDVLLLDEPTNHLDLEACDSLVAGLKTYNGTVLVVSHNRDFLDALVEQLFWMGEGRVEIHLGNYHDYELRKAGLEKEAPTERVETEKKPQDYKAQKEQKKLEAQMRQQKAQAKKKITEDLLELEKQTLEMETEVKEIDAFLMDPQNKDAADFSEKLKRRARLADKLELNEQAWLTLQQSLENN